MKTVIFSLAILLSACSTTKLHFPDVPDELLTACSELEKVADDNTKISVLITTVTNNYARYHECKIRNDAWQQWYKKQKEIVNNINK